jgi:hypothetical protein
LKNGVQGFDNCLKTLDSGLRRNDEKRTFSTFYGTVNFDGLVKSPSVPHSGRVRVAPFEFTSNGGRGETLSRRVKIVKATFYEVINYDKKNIQF